MGRKQKTTKVFLQAPKGVLVKRYNVGDETRFTAPFKYPGPGCDHERLVGIHNGERFTYIHPEFVGQSRN